MINLKEMLKGIPGLDFATIEKIAKAMENDPELRKQFEANINNEGFKETIDKLAKEIQDLF